VPLLRLERLIRQCQAPRDRPVEPPPASVRPSRYGRHRAAIRDEGYDPDSPKVVATLDRVRADLAAATRRHVTTSNPVRIADSPVTGWAASSVPAMTEKRRSRKATPEELQARRVAREQRAREAQEEWIKQTVDAAPPLTAEQRAKLAVLLEPVRIKP